MKPHRLNLQTPSFFEAPGPTYTRLRNIAPVVKVRLPIIGPVWVTTTYDATRGMLKDQASFARDHASAGLKDNIQFKWWMPRFFKPLMQNMLTKDGADHKRLRALVEAAFARRDIEAHRPDFAALANRLLDQIDPTQSTDIVAAYTRQLPLLVICEMLGIPDADIPKVSRWLSGLTTASSILSLIGAFRGSGKALRYFGEQIEAARRGERGGLLAALVEAETDQGKLTPDELVAMIFTLFLAGHETTVHLLNSAILALHDHPDQKDRLLADWDLLPRAVEEFLRHGSPVLMTKPRFVTRDMEFEGVALKRGEQITALLGAANHDPARFDHPERLDLGRLPNAHLEFGTGPHVCLGMQLARAEAQEALRALYTRFPDIRLDVARNRIAWRKRIGMRAIKALPVVLAPQA